jgi:hypothetical protein
MDSGRFTLVSEGQSLDQGLSLWSHDLAARRFVEETFAVWNAGRMIKHGVTLVLDGLALDHFDGQWLSGYVLTND